jgi:hypothetical protein
MQCRHRCHAKRSCGHQCCKETGVLNAFGWSDADQLQLSARCRAVRRQLQGLVTDVIKLIEEYSYQQRLLLLAGYEHTARALVYDPALGVWSSCEQPPFMQYVYRLVCHQKRIHGCMASLTYPFNHRLMVLSRSAAKGSDCEWQWIHIVPRSGPRVIAMLSWSRGVIVVDLAGHVDIRRAPDLQPERLALGLDLDRPEHSFPNRHAEAVLVDDRYVYLVTTAMSRGQRSLVYRLDLQQSTPSWQQQSDLPVPSQHHAMAALDGVVYLVGRDVQYKLVDGTWHPLPAPPHLFVVNPKAVVIDNKLFLSGGTHTLGDSRIQVFDIITETWNNKSPEWNVGGPDGEPPRSAPCVV